MTIGKKFIVMFAVFFATTLIGAFFVFKAARNQHADQDVINLAGRQPMLTQKYFKEYQTEAFFSRSQGGEFGEDSFLKTKKVFDTTLDALINGGEAPLDLEMTSFITIPPTQDSKIVSKLKEVKSLWNSAHDDLKMLAAVEPNSAEYIAAYDDACKSGNGTMKAMNEAVGMYQVNSEGKMAMVLWTQAGAIGIVLLAIGFSWLWLSNPLIKLLNSITDKLKQSAKHVSSASEQISLSSQGLAHGSSEQASSLEETSASMEQMSSKIKTKMPITQGRQPSLPHYPVLLQNQATGQLMI